MNENKAAKSFFAALKAIWDNQKARQHRPQWIKDRNGCRKGSFQCFDSHKFPHNHNILNKNVKFWVIIALEKKYTTGDKNSKL